MSPIDGGGLFVRARRHAGVDGQRAAGHVGSDGRPGSCDIARFMEYWIEGFVIFEVCFWWLLGTVESKAVTLSVKYTRSVLMA